jgi:hypothetical protein
MVLIVGQSERRRADTKSIGETQQLRPRAFVDWYAAFPADG